MISLSLVVSNILQLLFLSFNYLISRIRFKVIRPYSYNHIQELHNHFPTHPCRMIRPTIRPANVDIWSVNNKDSDEPHGDSDLDSDLAFGDSDLDSQVGDSDLPVGDST